MGKVKNVGTEFNLVEDRSKVMIQNVRFQVYKFPTTNYNTAVDKAQLLVCVHN